MKKPKRRRNRFTRQREGINQSFEGLTDSMKGFRDDLIAGFPHDPEIVQAFKSYETASARLKTVIDRCLAKCEESDNAERTQQ